METSHFYSTIISRSKWQSSVFESAYYAAEKMLDTRTSTTHDFIINKAVLVHQVIQLSEQSPAWMFNRAKLWNTMERAEKRKDTQLAQKFVFVLPLELSADQNITLVTEFIQGTFVSPGIVANAYIYDVRINHHSLKTQGMASEPTFILVQSEEGG